MDFEKLKVAIVHDWLTGMRGGEKVLECLCDLFPQADIFTLLYNPGSVSDKLESHKIYTSFINKLPFKKNKYRNYLPLFPTAIEKFNFKNYHVILSTSHCVAKGIITPPDIPHISYLHTPMRYVWDMYDDYFGSDRINFLNKMIIPIFANYLRIWDVTSSNRVDWFLANSKHVAKRIKKYYLRDAEIIHPPVDTSLFSVSRVSGDYYLIVSALVPYKKVDLAIQTFNVIKKQLIVVGNGPDLSKLKKMAGNTIKFVDWQPVEKLFRYYSACKAVIMPGEEDFGIVPVEAMACGKPVIAYGRGGVLETVIDNAGREDNMGTGLFFYQQENDALQDVIKKFENLDWNADFISNHAKKFDTSVFKKKIKSFIIQKLES